MLVIQRGTRSGISIFEIIRTKMPLNLKVDVSQKNNCWWSGKTTNEVSGIVYAGARMCFPYPEWYVFEEIELPSEENRVRRADIVAISLWGKKRVVVGEIKASRRDYLNEIKDPSKRDPGLRFGNEFIFFLPQGMVDKDEVPENCGLYEIQKSGRCLRTKLPKQRESAEWTDDVFHSILAKAVRRKGDLFLDNLSAKGNRGKAVFRNIFRLCGKDLSFEDLQELVFSVYTGLEYRMRDAKDFYLDYDKQKESDKEVQELRELRKSVMDVCGIYRCSAEGFRRWAKSRKSSSFKKADLDLSIRNIENALYFLKGIESDE